MEKDNKPSTPAKSTRMRIKIDDATSKGAYSNTAVVHNNEMEFVIDFLFAEPPRMQAHVVSRVVTNPKAAKQLAIGLTELVKRYEERHGELKISPLTPKVDSENYH
ncbi:MAG: DUF3467 domain-containing protein [Deltaproteobacteria bacterium]|nr:DUF3467 domain-containing protein [Deltaproteobacteria bacterium]MBN2671818.1 DUF3467 domain-containing protein [Deltaproteobacteria bacterium]